MVAGLDTLELRWFLDGEPPRSVEESFRSGRAASLDERTDRYLLGTGEAIGIKLREGRLELKLRTGREPGEHGSLESWTKVSLPGPHPGPGSGPAAAVWRAVAKRRLLRHFVFDPAGELREADAGNRLAAGCQAELTRLTLDERAAWTLGFEAIGAPGERRRVLDACAGRVLGALAGFEPSHGECCGYPAWIAARRPR